MAGPGKSAVFGRLNLCGLGLAGSPLKFLFLVCAMFRSGSFGPMISKAEVLSLYELRRDRFYRFG